MRRKQNTRPAPKGRKLLPQGNLPTGWWSPFRRRAEAIREEPAKARPKTLQVSQVKDAKANKDQSLLVKLKELTKNFGQNWSKKIEIQMPEKNLLTLHLKKIPENIKPKDIIAQGTIKFSNVATIQICIKIAHSIHASIHGPDFLIYPVTKKTKSKPLKINGKLMGFNSNYFFNLFKQ